jgi:hypothetical protein
MTLDDGLKPEDLAIRLRDHPQARRQIDLARGWGGIGAFVLVALLALHAGIAPVSVGFRALLAGIVGYMAGWGLSVMVWRHLAVAEEAAARASAEHRRKALLEEIERRNASLAEQEALS